MRLRFAVLALLSSAIVIVSVPAVSLAHRYHGPHHNRGLTIAATPNPVDYGEGVLIYGQLNVPNPGGQMIRLYHRVNPSHVFTLISTAQTNTMGFYSFTRAEGVVDSNRSWFVTAPAEPGHVHSRTIHEFAYAAVSLAASPAASSNGYNTNQVIQFSGHVDPNHAGEQVFLQREVGTDGMKWRTLRRGVLGPTSNFQIPYRFRIPGIYEVRALFRRDDRNITSASTGVPIDVQQTEVPDFTINTSAPLIPYGNPATISGTLYLPGTTTADPNVSVTLWGHNAGEKFHTIGLPVTTDTNGGYSFNVTPGSNTVYQVRTTFRPPPTRRTAVLFEGVQDVVTIQGSATGVVGGQDQFTGPVSPDKAGSAIDLQRLGPDGDWHTIEIGTVKPNSTYSFTWTFGSAGIRWFRTRVPSDPANVGGASPPFMVTVTVPPTLPPTLPPAS